MRHIFAVFIIKTMHIHLATDHTVLYVFLKVIMQLFAMESETKLKESTLREISSKRRIERPIQKKVILMVRRIKTSLYLHVLDQLEEKVKKLS